MIDDLPTFEFAFPGPLRDKLVAAVLDGTKTTTTGLLQDYEIDGEPLPVVGTRSAVVDSAGHRVAVIELSEVRVCRLGDIDAAHARDEGEGHDSVTAWRAAHERFWHGPDYRGWLGDPDFVVDDDTPAVLERFRLASVTAPSRATKAPRH
ncbi:ASCH domain-containing protein [Actinoplanes solisilvae]|uniref:ASCH domain-containing protein n=1 Tax=Actinoplanes solisilvae TaxID=2486853 RepID=UPI000FD7AA77|nr:ASCH domain-containing protein [Actinoplanes solisilvae]